MKRKFIFIALVIGIILCSISTISANDVAINQTNEFSMVSDLDSVSNDSNAYSVNNVDIDNVVQSEKEDNQIVKEKSNKSLESTYINVSNIEMYFKNGTRFEAFLFDEQNNPLPDQKLVFTINGVNYNRTTNENGSASMAINLLPGNYLIQVNYEGTEVYDKSNANGSVKVLSNIIGKDIVKYYKNGTQYYATFLDDHGNPLVGAEVYFNINGVFYYRTTDENGSA
ncbi:MAG: Ig-like domain repeat protein, partial [Methanobrevibacter sp.]|nr:Ig-like domain repeat protein [Methanobrevibacter sp.]